MKVCILVGKRNQGFLLKIVIGLICINITTCDINSKFSIIKNQRSFFIGFTFLWALTGKCSVTGQ